MIARMTDNSIAYAEVDSPIGPLGIHAGPAGLLRITFGPSETGTDDRTDEAARGIVDELSAYFAGELRRFTVPLAPQGTEFQRSVWQELARVPFGETVSYAEIARRIGNPAAVRAVGLANARNPIPIVVPCHRVIGSDGSLTGYAGGMDVKRRLLAHEGVHINGEPEFGGLFDTHTNL